MAYDVEGQADAAAGDARVAALDDAFAQATERALDEIITADTRKAHRADLDREIVARARLWVAKFTVSKDATDDGRRQLAVSVRVDRDKLRARLTELGIADAVAPPTPVTPPTSTGPRPRTVAVLLRVTRPSGVVADYGAEAAANTPGVAALGSAMRTAGMAVVRAPTTGAAARATGDLPLDEDEAEALAARADADLALVAGVTVGAPTAVRGVAGTAALVTAHARLIDRASHTVLGEGSATVAALGDSDTAAIDSALAGAAADVVPAPVRALHGAAAFHGADTPVAEPGVVLIRIASGTPYNLVLAEQKYLAGAKGVHGATVRRLSPGGYVIGVATDDTPARIAQIANNPPTSAAQVSVKVSGDLVELVLR